MKKELCFSSIWSLCQIKKYDKFDIWKCKLTGDQMMVIGWLLHSISYCSEIQFDSRGEKRATENGYNLWKTSNIWCYSIFFFRVLSSFGDQKWLSHYIKLVNINGIIDKKYWQKISLLYSLINTNKNILLLYIKKITVYIKEIKNKLIGTKMCHLYKYNYREIEFVGEIHP